MKNHIQFIGILTSKIPCQLRFSSFQNVPVYGPFLLSIRGYKRQTAKYFEHTFKEIGLYILVGMSEEHLQHIVRCRSSGETAGRSRPEQKPVARVPISKH